MPISGLLVTLAEEGKEAALAAIAAYPAFTTGEREERWLPVAMEATDDAESRQLHDWLMSLHGVSFVDVIAVNFIDINQRNS